MSDIHRKIEAVWKIESTRLIAGIARVTHDVAIAEDLAQDALVAAIKQWPEEGIPDKPAAWLMTAAKRRAIDFLRRGRMLVELLPGESEVHGLLALTELQASRTAARRGRSGEAILLLEQDRSLWDYSQIHRGMAALQHSQDLGGGAGNYALQAAIAACHARAATAADTDWERILLLYDALLQISPSPIVALNRAVAGGIERVCPYLPEKQGYGDSLLDCSSLLCCSWLHLFQKRALQDGQTGHAKMHRSDGKAAAINGSGYPPSPGLVGIRRQIMQ
jgi:predicted RNA polymerase sigma factor